MRHTTGLLIFIWFGCLLVGCSSLMPPLPTIGDVHLTTVITLAPTPADKTTLQLARGYLAAILASDQASLNQLIAADAWCSTPGSPDIIRKHSTNYGSAKIRNIRIEELDITGWVAYPPGAEAARISFDYQKTNRLEWIPASMMVVTVHTADTKTRFICDVSD